MTIKNRSHEFSLRRFDGLNMPHRTDVPQPDVHHFKGMPTPVVANDPTKHKPVSIAVPIPVQSVAIKK